MQFLHELDWESISFLASDVDETLISDKSMISFLDTLHSVGLVEASEPIIAGMQRQHTREEANEVYYQALEGLRWEQVLEIGKKWFHSRRVEVNFWIEPTVQLVNEAISAGVPVFLLSGSHRACLQPIADCLGSVTLLCTELEVYDGLLTGRRTVSAIGQAKADRLTRETDYANLSRANGIGLGDHESDFPFMRLCGQALLVGPDRSIAPLAVNS